jgi:hypothetical protein
MDERHTGSFMNKGHPITQARRDAVQWKYGDGICPDRRSRENPSPGILTGVGFCEVEMNFPESC